MKISKALKESIAKQNSNWYSPSRERERGKKFKLVYTQSFAFVDGFTDQEIEVFWNFSSVLGSKLKAYQEALGLPITK